MNLYEVEMYFANKEDASKWVCTGASTRYYIVADGIGCVVRRCPRTPYVRLIQEDISIVQPAESKD